MKQKIIVPPQEVLDKYEFLAEEFLQEIFSLKNGIFTDLTEISDFCGVGLSEEQINSADSYNAICTIWDSYIIDRIKNKYGIELERTNILLTEVLEKIQNPTLTFKH